MSCYEVVKLPQEHPEADMIYRDEISWTPEATASSRSSKPDWSPDTCWR